MKKINITFVTLLLLCGLFTINSCKKDNTTFTTYNTAAQPVALSPVVGADGTVSFTGTTVDLKWSAENNGPAALWDVYFGTSKSPALFQSGVTQPSVTVTVADGITYFWKIVTTDANGIVTTSDTYKFTAINGTNPKLTVNLLVTTDVASSIGVNLDADNVVDLRLLILRKSDLSIVSTVDVVDAANEVYRGFLSLPDDEYLLAVDIKSTIDAGTINKPVTLSLQLKFAQLGVIDELLDFPNVMTNVNSCSLYRTNLATVKKVGSKYTITRTISNWVALVADPTKLVGTWKGTDADPLYPSEVVSAITGGQLLFDGIGRGWMQDAWGEVIITHPAVFFNFNYCKGTITIPNQRIMTTTYLGKDQPAYFIEGKGTFDMSGTYPKMIIHYDFIQSGIHIAPFLGFTDFTLEITLNPAGKGFLSSQEAKGTSLIIRPSR